MGKDMELIKDIYIRYKLHFLGYIILAIMAVVLAIQVTMVIVRCIKCYPIVENYVRDSRLFRR